MTFDFFGTKKESSSFNDFVNFIISQPHDGWEYFGMNVELNPTVDFINENIKIRWYTLDGDFNDKVILSSIKDFNNNFIKIS